MTRWLGSLTMKLFSFKINNHANHENMEREAEAKGLMVIGCGFGRTGTTSLKVALETLLDGRSYHMMECFTSKQHLKDFVYVFSSVHSADLWRRLLARRTDNHFAFWIAASEGRATDAEYRATFAGYVATVDLPGCMQWKELLRVYPDARVILTLRESSAWFDSCCATIFQLMPASEYMPLGVRYFPHALWLIPRSAAPLPPLRLEVILATRAQLRLASTRAHAALVRCAGRGGEPRRRAWARRLRLPRAPDLVVLRRASSATPCPASLQVRLLYLLVPFFGRVGRMITANFDVGRFDGDYSRRRSSEGRARALC